MHIDWTINVTNLLAFAGIVIVAARWIVTQVIGQIHRIDLIEKAVIRSGWLRRNKQTGQLELADRAGI